jgi:flagellar hook-associated protein 1 FlgK
MDGRDFLSSSNDFKTARFIPGRGVAEAELLGEVTQGLRIFLKGAGEFDDAGYFIDGSNITTIISRHHLTKGELFSMLSLRDDELLKQMDFFDDMMYEMASEFNAVHYAGFGMGDYEDKTGMAFFNLITNKYGAFGKLGVDQAVFEDPTRVSSGSGDGFGKSFGIGDGSDALEVARLKQAKIFMNGIADFNDLYRGFVAELGAFGQRSMNSLSTQDYVVEQVDIQRKSIMGVNSSEEMLSLVELNNNFNKSSQYISTLFQVIDKIISGVGRVGQ